MLHIQDNKLQVSNKLSLEFYSKEFSTLQAAQVWLITELRDRGIPIVEQQAFVVPILMEVCPFLEIEIVDHIIWIDTYRIRTDTHKIWNLWINDKYDPLLIREIYMECERDLTRGHLPYANVTMALMKRIIDEASE